MTPEAIDRKLQDLAKASERIKASLLELELDPNRELLDKLTLVGDTAVAWATVSAVIAQLWQDHAVLEALLERAQQVRGTRSQPRADRVGDLQELLEGQSIELPDQIPLERRQLHTIPSCSPDELLTRMSAAFDEVKGAIARVDRAWHSLGPRLNAVQAGLAQVAQLARGLGDTAARDCDAAAARCGELTRSLAADPLSVNSAEVEALEGSLAELRQSLAAIDELRRTVNERLREAASMLELLQMTQREAEEAHANAVAKIIDPALMQLRALPAGVDRGLEQIRASADAGAWREANDLLARWGAQASVALEHGRRVTAASRASIEARNELRGLLDAYQGRARRLRLTEDPALAELLEQARASLYTAPTDLEQARELVRRYQRALAGESSTDEVAR